MPLYDNILSSKKNDNKESAGQGLAKSNASMKLLQDHLLSKRRSTGQSGASSKQKQQTNASGQNISHKKGENDWDPEDEYDPMMPNSYELLQADYLKAEELRLATLRSQQSISSASRKITNAANLLDVLDKLEECGDDFTSEDSSNKKIKGTAIAPPTSLSASIAPPRSISSPRDENTSDRLAPVVARQEKTPDGGSVAAKIMSKMGYKQGQGLGKDEQGISSPLQVEQSGLNAGRIVHPTQQRPEKSAETNKQADSDKTGDKMAELLRESTRVLLLQNMVGPGEVDDDLEAETKEECKKYGDVVKCLIFEIPNKRVPDDEAVRIFIEFKKVESAIKAASDLNGRYFGGRIVRASFYSVDKFNKYELGPT